MQKKRIIVTLFFCVVCIMTNAQVLHGYVKTKGRIGENGAVIPGKRLAGVVIHIVGANPVISKEDGSFSLNMSTFREGYPFRIQSIRKDGYELLQTDIINREMAFSSRIPMCITMVETDMLSAEKKRIEENAYRTLEKNYQKNLALLEKQMEDGTISVEIYFERLQNLQERLDNFSSLIEDLAERYARTDYDELSKEEYEINICIENGELEKADSMINMLFDPIDILKRNRGTSEIINHKKAQADIIFMKQLNNDAKNLYKLYELSLARLDNEKALFYIETRAELDSSNVAWQTDAGSFIVDFIMDQKNEYKAMNYLQRAIKVISTNNRIISKEDIAKTYHSMGNLYYEQGNFRQAQDNYNQALENYSEGDEGYVQCIERIAVVYNSMKRYSEAERFHKLAIELYSKRFGQNHNTVAYCYNNIGAVYENLEDYHKSEECYSKAINIWKKNYGENYSSTSVAVCYNNLGDVYDRMKEYDKAIEYYQKSLETYKKSGINPERNINIACVYNNLGSTYYNMSDYVNALTYYGKAIKIMRFTRDISHPDVRAVQENIAIVVGEMSQ